MAVYRYQVTSVGLWRGQVKRWNTTFHAAQSDRATIIMSKMNRSGYKAPGDVVGACSGGTAQIAVYNAAGGAPISVLTAFDWQAPGTWIPYTGENWATVPEGTPVDAAGESALVVVGNMAGLSATGKRITTRKYFHAVPSRSSADYSDPDVDAATQAAFVTTWIPTLMANPAGVSPTTVTADAYYGNHQRVRGRRRTTKQVATQAFSYGVLAGGGATTSGQGEPFPGGEF